MSESVQRRTRYAVIEALYEAETSNHDAEDAFARRLAAMARDDPEMASAAPRTFGSGLVQGIIARREELDAHIQAAATKYPVRSLAVVDRNILRLAIWELLSDNSAPVAAVVNEAVELARRYGGERSPGFVNGVLRTVSSRIVAERSDSSSRGAEPAEPAHPPTQET